MEIRPKKTKPGPKPGTKQGKRHTNNEWAALCEDFVNRTGMSQKAFLESGFSGPEFSGTASEMVTFSKKLKAFKEGKLQVEAVDFKRKSGKKAPPAASVNVEDDEEPDAAVMEEDDDVLTHIQALEALAMLGKSSKSLGVPPAANVHLDRYRNALTEAKASKRKADTSIHDFFDKKRRAN